MTYVPNLGLGKKSIMTVVPDDDDVPELELEKKLIMTVASDTDACDNDTVCHS